VDYRVDKDTKTGQFTFRNVNGIYAFVGYDNLTGYALYKNSVTGCWTPGQTNYTYSGGDVTLCGGVVDEFWLVKSSGTQPNTKWGISQGSRTGTILAYEGGTSVECAANIYAAGLYIDPTRDVDSPSSYINWSTTIIRPFGTIAAA